MKALVFALVLLSSPLVLASMKTGTASFAFHVSSQKPGCIYFHHMSATSDFPTVRGKTVQYIYWYYAKTTNPADVTVLSPYFASSLVDMGNGALRLEPNGFCGLSSGHYMIKYGLMDSGLVWIELQDNADVDPVANSVDVK